MMEWAQVNCTVLGMTIKDHPQLCRPLLHRKEAHDNLPKQQHTAWSWRRDEKNFADLEMLRWGRDQPIRPQDRAPFGFKRRFEGDNGIPPSVRARRHQLKSAYEVSVKA